MDPLYPTFTAIAALASALCLFHSRTDRTAMVRYGSSLAYGFILEKMVIVGFAAYSYPAREYLVSVAAVPLAIAFGWSAIIYAGIAAADALGVPRVAMPGFVGLFALHVDLSMDAIAIRVPYWSWTDPGPWFGVPLGNFFGWFAVAALFAGWWLVFERRIDGVPLGVAPLTASLASLYVALEGWTSLPRVTAVRAGVLVGLGLLAVVLLLVRRPVLDRPPPLSTFGAVMLMHGYFVAVLFGLGIYRDVPVLVIVATVMVGIGVGIHLLPGWLEDGSLAVFPA
ncbi:MAG: carotenoid biosynthesis protein [Halanaeroarchaeum sp.]